MNIGFDIDNTLTDIEGYKKNTNQKLINKKFKSVKTSYLKQLYSLSKIEFEFLFKNAKAQYKKKVAVRKDARFVLKKLKQQGHNIFIITKRFNNNPYKRSYEWLKKNKLVFDKLIVNAGLKVKACKKAGIDFFVDDDVKTCDFLNKNGIKAYLLTNKFNKNKKTISKRVTSLKEFMNIVLKKDCELEK